MILDRVCIRFRQFLFAMSAAMNEVDWHFVNRFLNPEELVCFKLLPEFEQKHSVIVAQKMEELAQGKKELDQRKAARIGLLHDIGKSVLHLSVMEKSVLTVIRFILRPLYNLLAKSGDKPQSKLIYRKFYYHKHHPAVGAEILENIKVDQEIVNCTRFHDNNAKYDNIYKELLVKADTTW
ncbi:HDIG domain-containing metalloprotein [Candidatus Margulisiibacteriota bacterium]